MLGPGPRGGSSKARESVLPSTDSGYTAFVPVVGGARRPVTVLEAEVSPPEGPAAAVASPLVQARREVSVPPLPRPEEPRRPVTVILPEPPATPRARAPEEEEEALSVSLPPETARAADPAPAAKVKAPAPDPRELSLALLALARDRSVALRIAPEDMEGIQTMVDEAVRRAIFEIAGIQMKDASVLASAAPGQIPARQRGRLAGAGVGVLAGGGVATLVVLNWDVWVRGELVSSIGWLQQMGVMGAAGLAGAGAAAAMIALAWGRRRHRKVRITVTRTRSWGAPPAHSRAR